MQIFPASALVFEVIWVFAECKKVFQETQSFPGISAVCEIFGCPGIFGRFIVKLVEIHSLAQLMPVKKTARDV